jgi:protocatechuate 3,4-dioxygenase beta subunit
MEKKNHELSRRHFMIGLAGTGMASLLSSCESYQSKNKLMASPMFNDSSNSYGACMFTPEAAEGPYYIDGERVRNDVREDRTGQDLYLRLQVVDVNNGCKPIQNAVVDIWHCDAEGSYSGYPKANPNGRPGGRGGPPLGNPPPPPPGGIRGVNMHEQPTDPSQHFLRGVQVTNEDGNVEFLTIYPGWYGGRTVHIHMKAYLNKKEMITSQLYFPDALNNRIFTSVDPYRKRGISTTRNGQDMIAGAHPNILSITEENNQLSGAFIIGAKRS